MNLLRTGKRDKPEDMLVAEERALLSATELVCRVMEEEGVSRQELAERLGISPSEVTQRLAGDRNLTLRSVADMFHVLGRRLHLQAPTLSQRVVPADAWRAARTVEPGLSTGTFARTQRLPGPGGSLQAVRDTLIAIHPGSASPGHDVDEVARLWVHTAEEVVPSAAQRADYQRSREGRGGRPRELAS